MTENAQKNKQVRQRLKITNLVKKELDPAYISACNTAPPDPCRELL